MRIELKQVLCPQPKSKIKASDGKLEGKYKFFTSSPMQTRFIDEANYDKPSLIFGTGGNASVHFCDEPFSTSTDCLVMYGRNKIELESIYNYLKGNISLLEHGFKGAGLKHISKDYILAIEIELPSEAIQHEFLQKNRIVDEIIEAKRTQLLLSEDLVKSRFIEMFGDPVYNTLKLPTKPLSELGSLDRGRSKHRPRNDPRLLGGPYPLIQTGEVSNAGLYITGYQNTYSELGLKQSKMWKAGTLCITIAANIAQTAILTFDACFPDSVVGFIPTDEINIIYMHYWFSFFQKILDEQAPQVAQKNINRKILSELQVAIPSIEEQSDFATFVEQVDKSKFYIIQMQILLRLLIRAIQQKTTEVLL